MVSKRAAVFSIFILCLGVTAQARQIRSVAEALRLGDQASMNGQHSQAEEYYRLAWKAVPDRMLPGLRLAQALYAQTHYAEARRMLRDTLALKEITSLRKSAELALEKMAPLESLLDRIEKTAAKEKALLSTMHTEAASLLAAGPVPMWLVAPHVEYLLKERPSDTTLLRFLSDGYYLTGDMPRAFGYTRKLVKVSGPSLELFRRLGDIAVNVGDYDQARLSYKKALRRAVAEGREKEQRELQKLVRALPAFSSKIDALIESEDYEKAFRQLRKCLARNPTNPWAIVKMGTIYERIGRQGQAENLYQKAVLWHDEDPAAHYALGRFYLFKKKKFELALEEFRIFQGLLDENLRVTADPQAQKQLLENWREATRSIAYVYDDVLRQPRSAIVELGKLTGSGNAAAKDYYALGIAYLRGGKKGDAYEAMKKVIKTDPDSEEAKDAQGVIDSLRSESGRGFQVQS